MMAASHSFQAAASLPATWRHDTTPGALRCQLQLSRFVAGPPARPPPLSDSRPHESFSHETSASSSSSFLGERINDSFAARRRDGRHAGQCGRQARCEQAVDELPPKLQKIVKGFQAVPDPRQRYQQLLFYAKKLKPLAKEHQVEKNKVIGCVSQVWVLPTMDGEGRVFFEAESDSALTKGLAALLVEGLSGAPADDVLRVSPDFIQLLGLKQSLTPSRSNGFLNMLKLMQKKTLELYARAEAEKAQRAGGEGGGGGEQAAGGAAPMEGDAVTAAVMENGAVVTPASEGPASEAGGGGCSSPGDSGQGGSASGRPTFDAIRQKLEEGLGPKELQVNDVSHEHAGHAGVHKGAAETHFNVKVVSEAFEGLSSMKRHRLVYGLLADELRGSVHALSLDTKTPAEVAR